MWHRSLHRVILSWEGVMLAVALDGLAHAEPSDDPTAWLQALLAWRNAALDTCTRGVANDMNSRTMAFAKKVRST